MAVNPLGFVCALDGGCPRIITGKAIDGILPGYLVSWSGVAGAIGSGMDSYSNSDILVHSTGSGLEVAGVAIGSAASGGYVGVATRGAIILPATGTITGGTAVISEGAHGVLTGTTAGKIIGRAISDAASGSYALIHIGGTL